MIDDLMKFAGACILCGAVGFAISYVIAGVVKVNRILSLLEAKLKKEEEAKQ